MKTESPARRSSRAIFQTKHLENRRIAANSQGCKYNPDTNVLSLLQDSRSGDVRPIGAIIEAILPQILRKEGRPGP